MTLLDFFGKVIATGGVSFFFSFFFLMLFGESLLKAVEREKEKGERGSAIIIMIAGGTVVGSIALMLIGALGYIWVR